MTESDAPKSSDSWKSNLSEIAEKFAALYLDLMQQTRTTSMEQFKHADSMLTWAIGLMGAGVFYANNLLSSAPDALRLAALAPWILGILASLAARMIGVRRLETESLAHIREVMNFRAQVAGSKDILTILGAVLDSFVRMLERIRTMGLYWWWVRLWFAAHILAGTGIITVVVVSFLDGTAAALAIGVVILGAVIIFVSAFGAVKKNFDRMLAETLTKARKSLTTMGEKGEGKQ